MPFWQSRNDERDNDRVVQHHHQNLPHHQHNSSTAPSSIRKTKSMAILSWPRSASSPIKAVDRSPFPPRISSLNRVPAVVCDAERITNSLVATPTRAARLDTAAHQHYLHHNCHYGLPLPEMPGTVPASTIPGRTQGTRHLPRQHHPFDTTHIAAYSEDDTLYDDSYSDSSLRNSTASSFRIDAGNAPMFAGGFDLRNGHYSSSPPPHAQLIDTSSQPSSSPIMRKASPMPQAFPQPAYPTPQTPWQHATNGLTSPTDSTPPAGKTSQVLAKLTAECDRLRREIKSEKASKEEAVQQFQALKGRVNWLEDKNSTLTMQLDANENALARKERRMDDLKASLEESVARRKRAEDREAEMGRKLGETVSQAARDVSEAHMAQKNAENAYATLENEYNGLTRRIGFLRKEVEELTGKINDNSRIHKQQLTQLEILLDQQRNQHEKSERQVHEMSTLLKSYRDTEENTKRLETEMQDAVHEMRWVMRLHQSREGQESIVPTAAQSSSPETAKKKHSSSPSKSSILRPRTQSIPNGAPI